MSDNPRMPTPRDTALPSTTGETPDVDVDGIERLAKKATERPWRTMVVKAETRAGPVAFASIEAEAPASYLHTVAALGSKVADADFIVVLANAWPAIRAALTASEAARARAEQERDILWVAVDHYAETDEDDEGEMAKEALAQLRASRESEVGASRREGEQDAARQTLHAAASDLRFVAGGGSCDPRTLLGHADALLALAATPPRAAGEEGADADR
jgi:hypothetical protein